MKYNPEIHHRRTIRLKYYDYSTEGYYFITICTKERKQILCEIVNDEKLIAKSVGVGVPDDPKEENIKIELYKPGKILEEKIKLINLMYEDINIHEYVIMSNHVHFIIEIINKIGNCGSSRTPTPTNMKIPSLIYTIKRLTNKKYGSKLWQRNYYEHVIRN